MMAKSHCSAHRRGQMHCCITKTLFPEWICQPRGGSLRQLISVVLLITFRDSWGGDWIGRALTVASELDGFSGGRAQSAEVDCGGLGEYIWSQALSLWLSNLLWLPSHHELSSLPLPRSLYFWPRDS